MTDDKRLRLKNEFPFYARNCLKVRTKQSDVLPFNLNKIQLHVHERLEQQLEETGKVRAILLKGRQGGGSTYVQGRFTWKTTFKKGMQAFILTHEDKATKSIFAIGKRFFEHLPPFVKPVCSLSNAKELLFEKLDSGYQVGTAGNKAVGRSQTNQLFHGSEVAFWPNAAEHAKGILQTIPDMDGTEVIYESTANGVGNFFHQQWKMAESGESEFIAIFVPWYWSEEYRKSLPEGFTKTEEEQQLFKSHDLDNEQIYFRRAKIIELSADGMDGKKAFMQEYPMNAAEAFQVSGGNGLISAESVLKARANTANPSGSFVVGVDPSRGGDRFSFVNRMGRKAWGVKSYVKGQCDKLGKNVALCKKVLDTIDPIAGKKPDMMFIDFGSGADIADRLIELGYEDRIKVINFGSTPLDPEKYVNKRAEMWGLANAWLNDENVEVDIPDSDSLQADLCASPYERDSNERILMWKKTKIKKEYGFSPDEGDAFVLTFAEPVVKHKSINNLDFDSEW